MVLLELITEVQVTQRDCIIGESHSCMENQLMRAAQCAGKYTTEKSPLAKKSLFLQSWSGAL